MDGIRIWVDTKVFNPQNRCISCIIASICQYSLSTDLSQIHGTLKVPTYTKEIDLVGQANNLKNIFA